jgi:uncharacterized protein (UPF0332 family)
VSRQSVLYFAKARRALDEAKILLAGGHTEGACNRAYYAMFDAAHAALWEKGVESSDALIKTHNGLLALFGKELVQKGHVEACLGRALSTVQNFRQIADYEGDPPALSDTAEALRLAETFVAQIGAIFFANPS